MARTCSTNGKRSIAYRKLMGKTEGKMPVGAPRRRWVDVIRMDHSDVGLD
jgi:hypothetical protein